MTERLETTSPPLPANTEEMREAIARVLYECERRRSEHADLVLSAAAGKPVSMGMEPWDECKDMFLGDATAILALPGYGVAEARKALQQIVDLKPEPFDFPADWSAQIDACEECRKYAGHPIQQGICDTHRRPLWDREAHDRHEAQAEGPRAKSIARTALANMGER